MVEMKKKLNLQDTVLYFALFNRKSDLRKYGCSQDRRPRPNGLLIERGQRTFRTKAWGPDTQNVSFLDQKSKADVAEGAKGKGAEGQVRQKN